MNIEIPDPNVGRIAGIFADRGFRTRLVGGAVRDIVLGIDPKDMDLATDALPETVISLALEAGLKVVETGLKHGTVTVVADGIGYEVTTLRRDVSTDGRHAEVAYCTDFTEDAARRDFTFNAMSADPDGTLHDPFGGRASLERGGVDFVGDPAERIREDYLRILRYFRFRGRFGVDGHCPVPSDVKANAEGLSRISGERIWSEMSKIMAGPNAFREFASMKASGVLAVLNVEYDDRSMLVAEAVIRSGGSAALALGVLCGVEGANRLAENWKVSRYDRLEMEAGATVKDAESLDPAEWAYRAYRAGSTTAQSFAIAHAALGHHNLALLVDDAGHRVFPLKGADLVNLGFAPGPDIGKMYESLLREWVGSGFAATKEELLSGVQPMKGFCV